MRELSYDLFCKYVKMQRESKGITMRKMASDLGISHEHLRRIEKGSHMINANLYIKICDYLEIPFDYFVNYTATNM